ncbi:MAG TPA: hypothetical protein PL085_02995 [Agriterribacter sp.]|nr:hypothetical protein [Agriterribacter sp.]
MSSNFDCPSSRSIEVQEKLQRFKNVLMDDRDQLYKIENVDLLAAEREVEQIEHIGDAVVCTTYFTTSTDPQRNIQVDADDIKYIEPWYFSVLQLNLFGIVFYDNLSKEFIQKYQTPNIRFVKCKLGNFSLNDERFIIYYLFFLRYSPSYILFTDGNDVTFTSDPFPFFGQKSENTIFVGRGSGNKIYQSNWNINSVAKLSKKLGCSMPGNFFDLALYNAGIIGGSYTTTMYFLRQMSSLFLKISRGDNNNMAAMHYVLYNYFYPNCRRGIKGYISQITGRSKIKMRYLAMRIKLGFIFNSEISYNNDKTAVSEYIFSGFPLNSKFKKFEIDSNAYIIHK